MTRNIKILIIVSLILTISVLLIGCGNKKPVLNVYNWGDYIDPSVIRDFEKEFNVKVNYNTFATNEDMYVSIKKGGTSYDVAFPSDYMIERMINEGLLEKIDKENIPNIKYIEDRFLNLEFDPNNDYSVPYMWGTFGIIYNKNMVLEEVDSWNILWDEKYKDQILMLDSQRDSIAVALKKLGYSMNSRNIDELEEAKEELIKQKPLVYAYVGDEVKDMMIGEEAALAVVWSGDAVAMIRENDNLEYVIPREGTNLWFDSMVIPKNSKNKELAEQFINFMNRPEIAARNTDYIGYSTPNYKAMELLPEDIINSKVAYPTDEEIGDVEIFKDPKDIIKVYDEIWLEIKAQR
ncbi:spermidine/putrescine transport system substrate-binding protein [Keratinibaculum paraultunense]|uniref:Spermidine/putrescine transport system substrate-binding protein n=1 Tax=Keratinibaculum paraultunense TaxID=1278232 RepID=A0A4R3L0I0_9FIRM|nr:spermidine/putrescine ABC transporter substrate-binding protein [Keratinibaculum paraultunense]QQY80404.1 spermidine/putrescine ABC transporter substrate-binding protein [Keratinibaculum paraultunense]TCS91117.1 spermidine/putrescine transport system substrate-binding protein [Keratinibaculum paraultunense]